MNCDVIDFFECKHLKSRDDLIKEMVEKFDNFSDDELKSFYLTFCLL